MSTDRVRGAGPQRMRLGLIAALFVLASVAVSGLLSAAPSTTAKATALDRFLEGLDSWQAEFTQTVTDSRGRARPAERGRLLIERPGKFRWEIGGTQVMVADGLNLWFHDLDLDQITVKPATRALAATPASLLAGSVPLRTQFRVAATGSRAGLEWVTVTPVASSAEFREARLAFSGRDLRRMELTDTLGQRVVLEFPSSNRNVPIAANALRFVPPPGVDVIGTPLE